MLEYSTLVTYLLICTWVFSFHAAFLLFSEQSNKNIQTQHFLFFPLLLLLSFSLIFSYVTSHPPWPPLLYLLSLPLDRYRLLSGSQWLRPAVRLCPLMVWHGWSGWISPIPQLSRTGCSSDSWPPYPSPLYSRWWGNCENILMYHRCQINLISRLLQHWFPTAGKRTSGLIVFWINRAASLSVHDAPLSYLFLQFFCLPVSLSHWYVHTIIKKLAHVHYVSL